MAKLDSIKKAKKSKPFGSPAASDNGRYQILIPEGAESGLIPDSDQYIGKLTNIIQNVSKQGKGNPQYVFSFQLTSPKKYRGYDFDLYCPLVEKSMWKLADTLTALGVRFTPGKQFEIDRERLKGVLVRLNIKKQAGSDGFRDQSKIQNVLPHPDGAGKKSGSGAAFPLDDEEPEEQNDAEQEEEEEEIDADDEETPEEEEDEDAEENEDEEDEDEEESEDEDEEEGDDEESEEGDDEKDDWDVAGEAQRFEEERFGKAGKGARADKAGRPRLKKDKEYADVTPKRRAGPKVVEKPVKRGRGRPPKKR